MKNLANLILLVLLSITFTMAQAPQAFNYQAVVRDAGGALLESQNVSFRTSILAGSATGLAVYSETHAGVTNVHGLVTLVIGNGVPESGLFSDIAWGNDTHFLKIELDAEGGTDYQPMGTVQLLSVPYASFSDRTAGIMTLTSQEILEMDSPVQGMIVLCSTDNQLYVYNGTSWLKVLADTECFPQDVTANAGPDQLLNDGENSTVLEGNAPLYGTGEWTIIAGTGGVIEEPSNPTSAFTGTPGTTYTLRWSITSSCNSSFDEVDISIIATCPGSPTVTDVDGNVYGTLLFGDQCWMAENLNTGTMVLGNQTDNGVIEKYCYNNLTEGCDEYGGMYSWDELMQYTAIEGAQGICPAGWHVPSLAEWCTLSQFVDPTVDCGTYPAGTDIGIKMKSATGWIQSGNGTNESGFNALPAGYGLNFKAGFNENGTTAGFWSSTEDTGNPDAAHLPSFSYAEDGIWLDLNFKALAWSVRCVKD